MARMLLNTLYVQTDGALVRLDHDVLRVEVEGEKLLQVPVQQIGSVVLFGSAHMTAPAMHRCVSENREVTFLSYSGRFRCRVVGPTSGNVLLRRAQHMALSDASMTVHITKQFVMAKIRNSRHVLMRGARDAKCPEVADSLRTAATCLATTLAQTEAADALDYIRGSEGEAARVYFGAFQHLITARPADFAFALRTRRPPRDRVNALLSFVYALLCSDCAAACETVGLDPQVGYLHCLRSGRPALALDLAEEFRAGLADRLVLTLINRGQVKLSDFDVRPREDGAVMLNEDGRRTVLSAYQAKKREEVQHPLLKGPVPLALLPQIQARLLARYLRQDLECYHPFRWA